MAIEARYTEKVRDNNGNIVSYDLVDRNGKTINIGAKELKNSIRAGKINVQNLTLTSDNRLVDAGDKRVSQYNVTNNTSELRKINTHRLIEKGVNAVGLKFDIEKVTEQNVVDGYATGLEYKSGVIKTPCFGEWELTIQIENMWKNNGKMSLNNLQYWITLCEVERIEEVGTKEHLIGFEKFSETQVGYMASCQQMNELFKRLMISKAAYKTNQKALDKMINMLYKHNEVVPMDDTEPITLEQYKREIYKTVNN